MSHLDAAPAQTSPVTLISDYLDKALNSDQAAKAVETARTARTTVVATAKAHPVLSALAVLGGIAAIGLLANPATRRAAIAGGAGLWSKYGHKLKMPVGV